MPWGVKLAHFSHFLDIFGACWTYIASSLLLCSICFEFSSILDGFGTDFGWILGGFLDDFCIFLENADFVKIDVFPKENCYF